MESKDACDRLEPSSDHLCRERAAGVLADCGSATDDPTCHAFAECLLYRAESIKLRDELCSPDASQPSCIITQRKLLERGTVAECARRLNQARDTQPAQSSALGGLPASGGKFGASWFPGTRP